MDSELDSSLPSPSIDLDSTISHSKKGRVPARTTWIHTRLPQEGEDGYGTSQTKYCIHCEGVSYGTSVTTNMRNHLRTKHDIVVETTPGAVQKTTLDQLQKLYSKAESSGQTKQIDDQVLQKFVRQEVINEALVTLIIVRNLSFRLVEWPEFHALCRVLNPMSDSYLISAHSTVPKRIETLWYAQKDIVRKKLQSAISSIHLSLDIWTSPNRLLLLGICAHFVGQNQEKLSKALLTLRTVENHSGEKQFETLLPVLQDYGIVRKLGSIVSDNATTNDTLCRTIGIHLLEQERIDWDPNFRRIRCTGHVINLAVQAFLFQSLVEEDQLLSYDKDEATGEARTDEYEYQKREVFRTMGPLGKLHNIAVHIRGSPGRTKEFKLLAGRMIPLDNRTRWNSWYHMLQVALQLESTLDSYTKKHFDTLEVDYLSPVEWEKLRTISKFLALFNRATLKTQGDQGTIDNILFIMDIIIRHFDQALIEHKLDKDFSQRIQNGWAVFDKYYSKTDDSPLYAAALILHPARRTKYIQVNWKKTWQRPALQKVKKLWVDYREASLPLSIAIQSYDIDRATSQDLDDFDRIAQDLAKIARPASQDEYDDYNTEAPFEIRTTALSWWCQDQQRRRWPRLSNMAIDILSIPAMSDEPERVFSGARRTISWERAQLSAENIERLECLKNWHRTGISYDIDL